MMDLETLSVRPNAVILVIGAIKFNRGKTLSEKITEKDIKKQDCFYRRITIESCIKEGMHIDPNTRKWWESQEYSVKFEAIINKDRIPLREALKEFSEWFGKFERTKIWGNGSSFDCTILGEAYKICKMNPPWRFWLERDLRTMLDIGSVRMCDLPQYQKHNALYDCYRQIIGFQRAEKNIL